MDDKINKTDLTRLQTKRMVIVAIEAQVETLQQVAKAHAEGERLLHELIHERYDLQGGDFINPETGEITRTASTETDELSTAKRFVSDDPIPTTVDIAEELKATN